MYFGKLVLLENKKYVRTYLSHILQKNSLQKIHFELRAFQTNLLKIYFYDAKFEN
jgi:hypothetical protein